MLKNFFRLYKLSSEILLVFEGPKFKLHLKGMACIIDVLPSRPSYLRCDLVNNLKIMDFIIEL